MRFANKVIGSTTIHGWRFCSALLLPALCAMAGTSTSQPANKPGRERPGVAAPESPAKQAAIRSTLANLPLVFEPNLGQADPQVSFLARGGGYTLFLTRREAVVALSGSAPIRIRPSCAQEPQAIDGVEPTGGISNYFIGNDPARWTTKVPNYRKVQYTGVCPGVDVTYYGNPQKLEYDFTLSAWTDPRTVQVEYEGAESVRLAANGDLVVKTASGELIQHKPRAYQVIGGRQVRVEAGYRLTKGNRVEFALARYNRQQPLVIDPVLVYSTYLGGSGGDIGRSIAVDLAGNAYVTGRTLSVDFPTASPLQLHNAGGVDAFVAKISAAGTKVYATYLGGESTDDCLGIAVDASGNAYVTGQTSSINFPLMNPLLPASLQFIDAFVTKLNFNGSALLYSTYLGGTGLEEGTGIAVDNIGNAYITGSTNSTNFPATAGAFQIVNHSTALGSNNAFVTKLNTTLAGQASLVYSTYLGGSVADQALAIAVDSSGNAYVTGSANSSDFPRTAGSFLTIKPSVAGLPSAFVTKLNANGTGLMFSTYLGGSGSDSGAGIAVDTNSNTYVTGAASSLNFPTLNPIQAANGGGTDAFVTKLNPAGTALVYSTYLGGAGTDLGTGISVDSSGSAYVVGTTDSSSFPTQNALAGITSGFIFVSALNPAGNGFAYSTFLSGGAQDAGLGIAAAFGSAYVTGLTASASFPIANAMQPVLGGSASNAFVTVISSPPPQGQALRFVPVTPCRVADTRGTAGPFGGPNLAAATQREFNIPASPCGIPANALAYSLNLTVVPLVPLGFLQAFPAGQAQPSVSTLNSDGRVKANAAIVPAGVNGAVTLFASDPTNAIIDINGYFVPISGAQNLAFFPITPCRLADTRGATGTFGGPALAADTSRTFPVLAGPCGIPASAQAYAFNMTVVPTGPLGFLSAWPAGLSEPQTSTLNAPTGTVTANMAIIPAGSGGGISVLATNATNLIIDITGYFAAPGAGSLDFFTATPCRILDTRGATGAFGGPILGAGQSRSFDVPLSGCGIPGTAKALSLNATVVPPAPLGFLTLFGSGAIPSASTLNASDGSVVANAALVPAGVNGVVTAFTSNPSHLILDINGYFQ
jgi:hypothetical protein